MARNLISTVTILLVCFWVTASQAKSPVKKAIIASKKKPIFIQFPSDKKQRSGRWFEDTSKYGDITQECQSNFQKLKTSTKTYQKVDELITEKKYAKDYAAYTQQVKKLTKQRNMIQDDPIKLKSMGDIEKKIDNLYVDLISKHFPEEAKMVKEYFQASYRYLELCDVQRKRLIQTKAHYHITGKFVDKHNQPMTGVLFIFVKEKFQKNNNHSRSEVIILLNQPDGTFDFIYEIPSQNPNNPDSRTMTLINVIKFDLFTSEIYRAQQNYLELMSEVLKLGLTNKEGEELARKFLRTSKSVFMLKRHNIKIVMERSK